MLRGVGLQSAANYSLIPKQIEFRLNFWTPQNWHLAPGHVVICLTYFYSDLMSTTPWKHKRYIKSWTAFPHFDFAGIQKSVAWRTTWCVTPTCSLKNRVVSSSSWLRYSHTAGNSNVTSTLRMRNVQGGLRCLCQWVYFIQVVQCKFLGVCSTWICIGGGWPAGWNKVVQRRSS